MGVAGSGATKQAAKHAAKYATKERAVKELDHLPPFSVIMNRLIVSLAGNEIGIGSLAEMVEKDAVISGNLLHIVNSALYARRGTINSVRHALSLLGLEKVRNVVLGMSVTRMWSHVYMPPSLSVARFNVHSSAVAILSDCLAQRVRVTYGEGAFVAGLLHDVGRLLIALSFPEQHETIVEMNSATGRPVHDCELEILGFSHPELSAEALTFWNLPQPIRTAVLYHHNPAADCSIEGDSGSPDQIRLSRVLSVANEYVNSLGISILSGGKLVAEVDFKLAEGDTRGNAPGNVSSDDESGKDEVDLFGSLGLKEDQTLEMLAEFHTEREAMAEFLR